jgi:hypothetical protein
MPIKDRLGPQEAAFVDPHADKDPAPSDPFGIEVGVPLVHSSAGKGAHNAADRSAGDRAGRRSDHRGDEPPGRHHWSETRNGEKAEPGQDPACGAQDAADGGAPTRVLAGGASVRMGRLVVVQALRIAGHEADVAVGYAVALELVHRVRRLRIAVEQPRNCLVHDLTR